jgi:hypothetical protein
MNEIIPDKIFLGEGTRQGKAGSQLDEMKKCDVNRGEVTQK